VKREDRDYRSGVGDDPGEPAVTDEVEDVGELRQHAVDAALHGVRLDKALVSMAPEFSRSHLQGLIARECVLIDGVAATTASRKLRAGQRIEVRLEPTAESRAFRAEPLPIAVVFEDEHLIIVDKPAGLVVHPAAGHWGGTLLNGLLAHHAGAAALPRAGIVHRLDKDTSGLMVVGKTLASTTALARAIAQRAVHREYMAIVHGTVAAAAFTVDAPIGRDPRSRIRMAVVASGKSARTDVHRVGAAGGFSALRCTLHSGRTHQIRVHLASQGHPLVGDLLYGGSPALGLTRQALHAWRLRLQHPASGAPLAFEAGLPDDMDRAWREVVT
jgi:23S rRNA pseudouridine1911/1915/1917 synthase